MVKVWFYTVEGHTTTISYITQVKCYTLNSLAYKQVI